MNLQLMNSIELLTIILNEWGSERFREYLLRFLGTPRRTIGHRRGDVLLNHIRASVGVRNPEHYAPCLCV